MATQFAPLPCVKLQAGRTFARPAELPKIVHLNDPALEVFSDFDVIHPVTVEPDLQIDAALERMKSAGVRLLLVLDEAENIVGLVTARDVQGERPIEIVEKDRIPRSQITVAMIMTRQPDIDTLKLDNVKYAQVGDIVATLKQLERQHILVVDIDSQTGNQTVCGLFSLTQIGKLLGANVAESLTTAHSLAEVVQELG